MATRIADPPILLVEDKDSLRAMLRHALEAQGHTVIEARDQQEAFQALRTGRPGLVLSDLRLPEGAMVRCVTVVLMLLGASCASARPF